MSAETAKERDTRLLGFDRERHLELWNRYRADKTDNELHLLEVACLEASMRNGRGSWVLLNEFLEDWAAEPVENRGKQ